MVKTYIKLLISILSFWYSVEGISQRITTFTNTESIPIDFLQCGKDFLLVTENEIFQFEKNKWNSVKKLPSKTTSAAYFNNKIWIGNKEGLWYFEDINIKPKLWENKDLSNLEVTSLSIDKIKKELIVSTSQSGTFTIKDNTYATDILKNVRVEDACFCGAFYWLATSTGLIRIGSDKSIQIYAEEGVGGFEIPDNIVDKLKCNYSRLCVFMPQAIAFLDTDFNNVSSHSEGFDFLGRIGNTVYDLIVTEKGDYIYLTSDGIICILQKSFSIEHEHMATTEVNNTAQNPKVYKVNNPILQNNIWKKGFKDTNGDFWFASEYSILSISKNTLKKEILKISTIK
jgi:hypothetical protein